MAREEEGRKGENIGGIKSIFSNREFPAKMMSLLIINNIYRYDMVCLCMVCVLRRVKFRAITREKENKNNNTHINTIIKVNKITIFTTRIIKKEQTVQY